jgi:hypothetical protein
VRPVREVEDEFYIPVNLNFHTWKAHELNLWWVCVLPFGPKLICKFIQKVDVISTPWLLVTYLIFARQ